MANATITAVEIAVINARVTGRPAPNALVAADGEGGGAGTGEGGGVSKGEGEGSGSAPAVGSRSTGTNRLSNTYTIDCSMAARHTTANVSVKHNVYRKKGSLNRALLLQVVYVSHVRHSRYYVDGGNY
jgi:hypothetical protein